MTTDLLDQIPHHCHILEAADDSFRFKASGEAIKRERNWQYRAPILHKGEKSLQDGLLLSKNSQSELFFHTEKKIRRLWRDPHLSSSDG